MRQRDHSAALGLEEHMENVDTLIGDAMEARLFSACAYGVVHHQGDNFSWEKSKVYGGFGYEADVSPITEHTFFDQASVTKSLPTAMLLIRLIDEGKICRQTLDEFVVQYLPEFKGAGAEHVTIRHLLSFGFELDITDNLSLFQSSKVIKDRILTAPVKSIGHFRYSNTTSFIATLLIERLYGMPYAEAAKKFIFEPLRLEGGFLSGKMDKARVLPTADKAGQVFHGVVHDPFSRQLLELGGTQSGAAGMFLNARDGMAFLRSLCSPDGPKLYGVSSERFGATRFGEYGLGGELRKNQLNDPQHIYGLGFDILDPIYGPCKCCTESTMLITGYTGCVMMFQPTRNQGFFLFTNMTHPRDRHKPGQRNPLYDLRRALFHNLQTCKHCFE